MKIRFDFVSNSSSSSYVISCKADYVDRFVKDLARACTDRHSKDEWHDPNLAKRNERILDFCFNSFELMFLGDLTLGTQSVRYDLEYFKNECKEFDYDERDPKKEFENYKGYLRDIKCKKAEKWEIEEFGRDKKILGEDAYWHFIDNDVRGIVIDKDSSCYELKRYHFKDDDGNEIPDEQKTIDDRVKTMIEIAESKFNENFTSARTMTSIDTYEITLDTIANTRELIAAGYKIKFDENEDLDEFEKRIKDGHRIFYLRIAHSGDGYGTFYIYCEDCAHGLSEKLPIEIMYCCD